MAKQYKVVVNAGKDTEKNVLDIPKNAGAQGKPLTVKAKAGSKYQLIEVADAANSKPVAPDFVKTRRVGKNLLVTFEGSRQADLIIEDYYDVFSSDVSALIGQAENGSFYEYIPEDPNTDGLVANLRDGGQAINVALGGSEVQGAGAAVGLLAINPLLGALGLAGAGAAAVVAANTGTTTTTTTTAASTVTGALSPVAPNDTGTLGDNRTNNTTPSITGTAPAGSAVKVTIDGVDYTTTAAADGTYTIKVPTGLKDGTYTPKITVTPTGSTTSTTTDGTPFTIDTVAPTVAISADKTSIVAGQTSVVTFTLSEATTDFTNADITTTGGTLGTLVQSTTNPLVYTATFTPNTTSTSASIQIDSSKFTDAAGNSNKDTAVNPGPTGSTYEANNLVTFATNAVTTATGQLASGSDTGKLGDNLTKTPTPEITGKAPANAAVSVNIDGVNYTTTADANGNYSVKVPNNLKDNTYTPVITVTPAGSTTPNAPVNGTPFTIDTTPGTIAITADKTSLVKGETSVITFTLSEAASDFTKDDIAVTGGSLGNLVQSSTNPLVYTATFTPTADTAATARISVASGKFSDAASNFNTDGDEANNKLQLPVNTVTNGGTAVLAPASDSGTKGDNLTNNPTPSITGKAPAGAAVKVTVNNVDYTTTADANGTYTIPLVNNLPDGPYTPKITVTPVGSTAGTPTDGTPFVIDTTPPTIALSSDKTALSTGQTTQITFTLSEPVSDFTKEDVEVTGGTLSNFQGSGKNYTATFTPTPGSTADSVIRVRSGQFADAAANTNTDGNDTNNVVTLKTDTTSVDTTPPTIAITSDKTALKAGETAVITFTLSEPSGNFELADITVTGGKLSNLQLVPGETMVYKAVFTPTAGSTVQSVISVASDTFTDASGNPNKDGNDANNTVRIDTNTVINANGTAALAATSDSGTQGDNRTLDNTPDITGTAPAGSAVSVVIKDAQGAPVGTYTATADASGKYTLNVPNTLADGSYTPVITVTPVGGTAGAATNGTPFVIDTVTTVAITNPGTAGSLNPVSGTAEAGDIVVLKDNNGQVIGSATADTNGNWSVTPTNPVPAGKVTAKALDAAGNTADAAGTPATNSNASTFTLTNDNATAIEAGASNPSGTQINMPATSGVLANDIGTNVLVTGIKLNTATNNNGVSSGSTSTSNFTTVNGQYGTLHIGADGSYTYTVDNTKPLVQGLRTDTDTLSEVFTYTGSNGSTTGSANLTVTIKGSNDAPVAVADTLTALEAGGTGNTTAGTAPESNVLSNDTDVDFGDQKIVQDIKLGTNASTSATLVPSTGTAPVTGAYGTLSIAADGRYSYAVDNNNAAVQALRTAGQTVSETFIYTMKDLAGATSTNTITVTVQGANDAPTYTTGGLKAQSVTAGDTTKPLNYQFAATAFNDVDSSANGETATYSATLADGSKLPDWLSFNPVTRTFSGTPPANTPAGTLTVKVTDTDAGGLSGSGNFDIVIGAAKDTTPPTVAISSNQASLSAGQTAVITFTLSEASTDFTWNDATQTGDISVSGGKLGALTHVGVNSSGQDIYTATFTPTANSTAAGVIKIASHKFQDAAGNQNLDTWDSTDTGTGVVVESDNTVTLSINTNGTAASLNLANDAQSVAEAGLNTAASNASGNVLSNDAGNTPKVTGIQLVTDTAAKPVNAGTSAATGTTITGQYGSLAIGADGQYIYTVDNNNPTVQALRTAGQTVSEVFSYTATDSTGSKSANLVVTITGTNDAPTLTTQVADQSGTVGSALKPLNVSTNFADVDAIANGETATYSIAPTSGNTLPAWLSINPSTGAISGTPTAAGTTTVVVTRTDAAGASVSDTFDIVVSAPAGTTSGQLAATSDTGTKGDNTTNDKTPDLTGTVPLGSTAEVKINGITYPVTVKPDGTWAFTQPTDLPDGFYTPELSVTPAGGGTPVKTNLTPFTIDTVAPTVAISASTAVLVTGQTSTITFTLSEASGDFTNADISTTGGSLGALVQSSTDPKVYTAVFTPSSTATSATITVDSERFSDAAGNTNKDTSVNPAPAGTVYEANNKVFLATNASTNGQLSPNSDSATKGDNLTNNPTPAITGKAPAGAAVKVTVNNVDYTTTADANGDYTIPQLNTLTDGPYTPVITVTPVGGSAAAPVNGTPFTVDTTTPTVAISASTTTLVPGQTSTISFTLSEASGDFTNADIAVTGGSLSTIQKDSSNPKLYTAVFTPTSTATSATITIDSDRFSDAAGNTNKDSYLLTGAENTNNQVTLSTNFVSTGALSPNSDSATKGDNLTNNPTPAITGKAPASAAVKVNIDGVDYTTTADANGNYTIPSVTPLKDGPYTPVITVTPVGGTASAPVNGTPFTIDTTTPTVAISASSAVLAAGQTSTITFTLSEAANDFTKDDITVTGGSLGTLMQSSTDPKVYTAVFTPDSTGKSATVAIDSARFSDAAGNTNKDTSVNPAPAGSTYEANNQVFLSTNAVTNGQLSATTDSGTKGDNKTNDKTPELSGNAPAGSTAEVKINGVKYPVTVKPDGTWTFTQPTDLPDGTYVPELYVTPAGGSTPVKTDLTPFTIDTVAPTVAISASSTSLTAGQTSVITFTLSEAATDFSNADIAVTGGTLGTLSSTDGKVYTAAFTPTSVATSAVIKIDSNKFSDAAANFNTDTFVNPAPTGAVYEANNQVTLATNVAPQDTTPPTVIVTRNGSGTLTSSETITFTLSEASKDFTKDDITVDAGDISNFTPVPTSGSAATGYTQYTATYTPKTGASGQATIGVLAGKFSDAAGNLNKDTFAATGSTDVLEDNNKVAISFNTLNPAPDNTPPTVIVARAGTGNLAAGGSDTITFTLSENSLTFDQNDITVDGGILTNWTIVTSSGSPSTGYHQYTATFTPNPASSGTATIGVKAGTFKDFAGNANQDTFEANQVGTTFETNNVVSIGYNTSTQDTTPPTVAVVRSSAGTITGPETIYFNFSEATTDFALSDIAVDGGSMSNLVAVAGSGNKQYSATFTPTASSTGTASIGVLSGKFSDAAGNLNLDTFDASSTHYETNNLVSATYNTSSGTNPVDTTAPKVAITRLGSGTVGTGPGTSATTETIVFSFSEAIDPASFTAADLDVSSGTISAISAVPGSNNTQFTATYTPLTGLVGNATIGIVAGKFSDVAGNLNLDTYLAPTTGSQQVQESNNQITLGYNSDTTPPTVIVSRATSNTVTGTETITFTLSEASTTLSKEDIDLIGTGPLGTLGTLTPDTTSGNANTGYTRYSIVYTAPANNAGDIKIGVLAGKFSDTVGNQNTDTYASGNGYEANNAVSLSYNTYPVDRVAPTIAVTRSGSGTLTGSTANETITFTLSEASTNFSESDITTTGGTLSNFAAVTTSGTAGNGYTRYTATFTPTASGSGTATVGVKSGQFTDNAGNANQDSYELTGAENANNQVSIAYNSTGADTTPPTIIVARTGTGTLAAGQTETLLFTTSEVAHFDETRITVIKGGTLSNVAPVASSGSLTTGYTQWTATFTPTPGSSGQAQIGVLNGKVDDMAGNFNTDTYTQGQAGTVYEANNLVSFNYDTNTKDSTPPTIVVTRSGSGTVKTSETIFFTLSEASKDFSESDIDVFGGGITGFSAVPSSGNAMTGYTQYVATFTPDSGKGVATIGVKSGKFSDAAQNLNADTYEQGATGYEANNQVFLDFNNASTDTTPPTVAVIRSTSNVLKVGATELVTFVLSEASLDFALDDIAYDGGTLSNFTRVTTSGNSTNGYTQYTAQFTPNANSAGTASIGVAHGKFTDAAGLLNQDTYLAPATGSTQVQEGNNQVKIVFNTVPASGPGATPDTASATETGGTNNNSQGINPSGSVLDNDTTATSTKVVQDINIANGTAKPVAANSSKDSNATSITGSYGTLLIGADGTYSYTVNNQSAAVEALRTNTDTLTDTFTYTINDGTSATASTTLTVTVRGANDAPVLVTAVADTSATIGTPFSYSFANTTFKDVDTGDTLSYTAKLAGGADLPSWLSFNPATRNFSGTAPAGAPNTLDIQITATDRGNLTASDTFQISIGNNHAPTLAAISAPAAIDELANAAAQDIAAINGVLVVNDADTGNTINASTIPASVTWSGGSTLPQGADVSELISSAALKFGTGVTPNGSAQNLSWTYDPKAANLDWLAKGQTLTLTYPVTINDGQGGSATQNLVITITGTNDAPVASNIAKPYNKGAGTDSFSLIGNATDLDNGETATLSIDSTTPVTYSIDGGAASTTLPAGITLNGNTLSIDPSNAAFATLSTGQSQVIVATYKIKDAQGATTQQTATLTIKGSGTGDPIAADDAFTITEQGGQSNNIGSTFVQNDSLLGNDLAFGGASLTVDTIKAGTAAGTASSVPTTGNTQVTGQFGTLSVNKSGGNTYELNNNLPAVQALQTGEFLKDTFTYTIKDSNGKTSTATLTMTINGANDAPVAVADTITVGEAGGSANATASTLPTTGTVLANDTDVDKTDSKTVTAIHAGNGTDQAVAAGTSSSANPKQISGSYGTLNLGADGSYSYTVSDNLLAVQQLKNAGDKLTDTFTYTVKDAAGLSSTSSLTVTITGANDAPTVSVATAPTSATNLSAFNFGTAFSLADVDVGIGLMTLTLSSDANDGRFTVNLGSSGATLTSGGNGTSNTAVISGTLAQLQALTSAAGSFSFVDSATQAAARDITISAVLNDKGNEGALANALTGSNSFKVSMAADPNRNATIDITAITNDTGYQANDYITADNTLVFSGTVSGMDASSGRVKLELVDSNNNVLKTAIVTPTVSNGNGTWTWTDPLETGTTGRADGDYTLRATIVDLNGNRVNPASTVGSNTGTQDVQAITIDTNTPNVDPNRLATIDIVTIDDGLSATTTATGSKDTGTSATDFITSDRTLAYKGTVTGWVSNNGDMVKLELKDNTNTVVATQYVLPQTTNGSPVATWSWDDTGISRNADSTYTLVATIVDKAGNRVNAAEPTNGTNGGTDSQLIVIDNTVPNAGVAPTVVITTDTNNDGVVSGKELGSANTFTVSGAFDKTKVAVGDILIFSDGTNSQSVTLSAADIGNGFATTTFAKPAEGATLTVTAKLQDAAGQTSATSAPDSAKLDTTAPNNGAVPVVEITTDSNNNGTVNIDELAGASTFTVKGSFDKTKVAAGDILVFKDANNNSQSVTLTATDINNGYATTTFAKPAEGGTLTVTVQVEDIYGNASTTSAPDSAKLDTSLPGQTVSFSSMTKDTGIVANTTANWLTADSSAGRLVSGAISAPLGSNEVVKVYANGLEIGNAVVNGTQWAITDTNGYGASASWVYTAKVVNSAGNAGNIASQTVNTDFEEGAPVITSVYDAANTLVGNDPAVTATHPATTSNTLSRISGLGTAGDTVYVYDNTYTNLVGSATVSAAGTWTLNAPAGLYNGSNTFAAVQIDAQGNQSVNSNLWTVSAPSGTDMLSNGTFTSDYGVGFTTDVPLIDQTNPNVYERFSWIRSRDAYSVIDLVNQRGGDLGGATPGSTGWNLSTDPASGTLVQSTAKAWTNGSWTENVYLAPDKNLIETTGWGTFYNLASGKILAGSLTAGYGNGVTQTLWASTTNVVAGQTYTFSFDYWNTISKSTSTAAQPGASGSFLDVMIDGQFVMTTKEYSAGEVKISYTATRTGAIALSMTSYRDAAQYGSGDYALDNMSFTLAPPANTLVPGAYIGATPNPDNLSYTAGALDALASNDTITVTTTSLQAKLAAGGIINGGAGIDNLKLASGTTLNLEALTGNQTVKPLEQIEMITLQGGASKLTLSANDVLSLGGANATTMAPYTFSSTAQVVSGGVPATGSTSSTGKVQFVVNGQSGDTLNLDVLANDGVTSTNGAATGLLGNTGLSGSWAYKGLLSITAGSSPDGQAHSYKVYDHSTTGAQVLVDVNVTVNQITPITISAISTDAGTSASDFLTNDQTLNYTGLLPAAFDSATQRVRVQLFDASNAEVTTPNGSSQYAVVSGTTWSWDNTSVTRSAGDYTLKATIVNLSNDIPVTSYGAAGTTTHALTIDLSPPTVAITRTDGLSTTMGATGTEVTFTVSEATTDLTNSDIEVNGGFLSPLVQSSTNPLLYTATFTPTMGATGTASVRIASGKFTDAAGNLNLDTYVSTDANYQANNLLNIAYDTAAPTQTVSFSSMTKDSGVTPTSTINSNWLTNDSTAGRLVSGFLSAPLAAGEVVNVYADGNLIGTATVASGGTTWEITDLNGYGTNASWTYTANVVDAQNNAGQIASQVVSTDFTEVAPTITGVTDAANASIATGGTTANALSTVKGTTGGGAAAAGATIYLYDNTYTNLVGTAIVDSSGNWSVTSLTGTFGGSNTFAAKQVDAQGNHSIFSNLWTVTAPGVNMIANGNLDQGLTGFTSEVQLYSTTGLTTPQAYNLIRQGNRYNVVNDDYYVNAALSTNMAVSGPTSWANGTVSKNVYQAATVTQQEGEAFQNFFALASGKFIAGSIDQVTGNATNTTDLWASSVDVVQGKTYTFSFVYWDTAAKDYKVGNATNFMDVKIDGVIATTTANSSSGTVTITYTANKTGPVRLSLESWNPSDGGDYMLDNFSFGEVAPANTLNLTGPTANPDTLTYTAGALDALASNDTITVTATDLQAKLAAGGVINGGAGIDNLKLAAGTTLNLETLTGNQTVKPLQQIEMMTLQGGASKLTLSANDVLSLGGSNATTMAPYSFSSTQQTGTAPTGSTTSAGKVQFVVNGQTGDTLNLDVLANDGVTSTNGASSGLLGNTGLNGSWAYKGTTSIAAGVAVDGVAHTYKVYDHSTTGAQVLVDVNVTVNTITPISITAISTDSGVSATDFITNDQTLTYSGGLPAAFNPTSERVMVEIVNNANQVVSTGFASPSGTTWSWVDTKVEAAGNYTIRSTIVGLSNTTAVGSYGAGASATQALTIDLTPPTVAIGRTDGLSTTVGATGSEVTFTVNEATTDLTNSDIEVNGGSLSTLVQSTTNPLLYTATFTPTMGATGTAYVRIASGKFSDAAGNLNLDTYVSTDANYQANNLLNIGYDAVAPQIAVTSNKTSLLRGETATLTFTLSENSNDFVQGDVTLTGGTLSNWAGSGSVYTATFTPDVDSTVESVVFVDSGKFTDMSGNVNQDGLDTNNTVKMTTNTNVLVTTTITSATQSAAAIAASTDSFATGGMFEDRWAYSTAGEYPVFTTNLWNISIATPANRDGNVFWDSNGNPNPSYYGATAGVTSYIGVSGNEAFTLRSGGTFNSLSFKLLSGLYRTSDPIVIKFYDANNTLLSSKTIAAGESTFSHSFTGNAVKWTTSTYLNNAWGIDDLNFGQAAATSGSTLMDTAPVLNGTISRGLASGETVQVFRAGAYIGDASIAVGSTSWTFQNPTTAAGAYSYTAKLVSGTTVHTASNAFSLSIAASPLVLDLNCDGVQTVGIEQGVQFDLVNTGTKQSVGWVNKHDGLLVMDLNGDGKINSGAELFGDHTRLADGSLAKDGWAALGALDANADGVIDAKDTAFNALNVWVDANGDGVTDAGELHTLKELGITAISLNTTAQQVAQNGNVLGNTAKFTTVDGHSHDVADVWFKLQELNLLPATDKALAPGSSSGVTTGVVPAESTVIPASEPGSMDAVIPASEPGSMDAVIPASEPGSTAPVQPDHCDQVWITEQSPTGIEPVVLQPASALIQNKPFALSPEQIAQFQAVMDANGAALVQPTHCDEPWLIQLNGTTGTEPVVFNPNPASWNKPFELSAEQMAQLKLPVPADSNLANQFKLNVSDVLLTPADAYAKPALQLNGQELTSDTLNLSTLLSPAAEPAHLTGTAQIEGQTFHCAANVSLQALIDQQQHHAAVS